jgi:hypothetical protein
MALEFKKEDDTCSNVYLIDERLCLKNSYDIINTNVATLSSNLNNLQTYSNEFNQLYSNFSNNSARWIRAISNFQTLSAGWFSAETTVKTLSSYWQNEKSIIYNTIVNIITYNNNTNATKTNISNWLNTNFKDYYPENQILNVDLYLSQNDVFSWNYVRSYFETCVPPKTSMNGDCNCTFPSYNCNRIWNWVTGQFLSSCNAVGNYCRIVSTESSGAENVRCPNIGNREITFDVQTIKRNDDPTKELLTDKNICKIITLRFKKQNNNFISI